MLHDRGTAADRIVFVGHATVLIELGGVQLLTDPLLRRGVAHLRRQPPQVAPGLAGGADAALISHLHRDHLDIASLRRLGEEMPMVVPAGAGAWLRRKGFKSVTELRVGDVADIGGLVVRAVQARHDGRRHPGGVRAETVGYLVQGRRSVYFAGDTEKFEEMSVLSPGLDLALVPVAGWGAKVGPGHMGPLEAANAVALLKPRVAVPIHWGTLLPIGFAWRRSARLHDPAHLFARHVANVAPDTEVRIVAPGEQLAL